MFPWQMDNWKHNKQLQWSDAQYRTCFSTYDGTDRRFPGNQNCANDVVKYETIIM